MKTTLPFLLVLLAWAWPAPAARAQPPVKIENFSLLNAVDNSSVSLSDFKASKAVVVIFTSNYCPFARLYEDRVLGLIGQFQGQGVAFLLVNSNTSLDHLDDSVEEMARRAREKKYPVPYLSDKEHKVAAMFRATKNPEAFVLQAAGAGYVLKYRGALDDNPQVPQEVTAHYLRDAVVAAINRKNLPYAEKRPVGCALQKE